MSLTRLTIAALLIIALVFMVPPLVALLQDFMREIDQFQLTP